ncbi:rRNA maturation RNase YbeY [Bacillus sp. RG28]|uniref:Endoribonuclease YbeY n=1 Tax=Gottfriedia endophytica TaxID=2820819 RepID=A0A940NLB2_9BACI|nr:rRNA maturation RNase YbeY [Gottfriedia endophytica]MBP0723585.1 rRNA maturation RNase YbeY [Gottfriedia endophytica]
MNLEIDFIDETNEVTEEQMEELQKLVQFTLEFEGVDGDVEMSVSFVDDERIHEINKEYRNKDRATDVISFAMEEMGEGEIEIIGADFPRTLGDIVISIPTTKAQAEEYGHSFKRELGFLAVHGCLHLLGYDHMTEEEEKIMFTKQKDILDQYGLGR